MAAVPPSLQSYPPSHTSSPARQHLPQYSSSSIATTILPDRASNTLTPASVASTSTRKTIYDRNLNRSRNAELSRASFAYLFMEMVSYAHKRVKG